MFMHRYLARILTALGTLLVGVSQVLAADSSRLWAESPLAKVLRSATPPAASGPLEVWGARDEVVSAQAVFRAGADAPSASLWVSDFRQASGRTVPAACVRLQWERYIDLTRNSMGVPADELVARAPVSLPDPYWEEPAIPVRAGQAQPAWLEFRIPADAAAGDYTGELRVDAGSEAVTLPVTLHVWNFAVPRERHLAMINWWLFPGPGFPQLKPDSDEYYRRLGEFCAFLVEHRQTDINTGFDLIGEDGDTSEFERYADTAFTAGIRQIHLHCVGDKTAPILDPSSRVTENRVNFGKLPALQKLIARRGWKRRFAVSITDEPFVHHEQTYSRMVDRVHEAAPDVRCVEAVEGEFFGKLDIWVPKLSHLNLWYPRFDEARRQGAELWYYICCHPMGRYPNRWVDQPLLQVRVLHWMNYLYNLDGFLHWALNHFKGEDFFSEAGIGGEYAPGERAIAYPGRRGLVGSLRFSAQRDGLQDFEYLWVLQDRLAGIRKRIGEQEAYWLDPRQRSLELCRRVVWSFHDYTREPGRLLATRAVVAGEIEALGAAPLLVVQTSPPEGTVVPAGPRHVTVRGVVAPGGRVSVNGKPFPDVQPSGCFGVPCFLEDGQSTITVTVEHEGKTRTVTRSFVLTD
jgi:hypothetical protein